MIISGTEAISEIAAVITGRAAASEKMAYIWSSDHFKNCSISDIAVIAGRSAEAI